MKLFISRLWKVNIWAYLGVFALACFSCRYYEFMMTLNGITTATSIINAVITFDVNMNIAIAIISIFYAAITYAIIRLYYYFFVKVYVKTFGTRMAIISELPIDKQTFSKFVLMFMILAYIVSGLVRTLYVVNPLFYNIVEFAIVPVINLAVAFFAFFVMKKYLIEGRVTYNVFVALAVPFFLPEVISFLLGVVF